MLVWCWLKCHSDLACPIEIYFTVIAWGQIWRNVGFLNYLYSAPNIKSPFLEMFKFFKHSWMKIGLFMFGKLYNIQNIWYLFKLCKISFCLHLCTYTTVWKSNNFSFTLILPFYHLMLFIPQLQNLELVILPNSISRKIWVTEKKSYNFHTENTKHLRHNVDITEFHSHDL